MMDRNSAANRINLLRRVTSLTVRHLLQSGDWLIGGSRVRYRNEDNEGWVTRPYYEPPLQAGPLPKHSFSDGQPKAGTERFLSGK